MGTEPSPEILDPPSEGMFIWEREGLPQTDYGCFSWRGPCDEAALAEALVQAQAVRPHFHAHLIATRIGYRRVLAWVQREAPVRLEVRDFTHLPALPVDLEHWVHEQLAGEIDHLMRLDREYPVRLILLRLPENHGCLAMVFHHVVTDGGGLYDFLRDAFRVYHRLVTGREPSWAAVAGLHAQAGPVTPVLPQSGWSFFRRLLADIRRYPPWRIAQLASRPDSLSGRNMVRYVFDDPALQQALRARAKRAGGTVSDLMQAAGKLALHEWNRERNAPADVFANGLAVNLRLRLPPAEVAALGGNPMSGIYVPSLPEHRRDPERLLAYVIAERLRRMAEGQDINLVRTFRRLHLAGRFLPVALRHRLLKPLMDTRLSFFLTNLGVVWPRMENGRPTGETAVREIGDLELLDVHSSVGTTPNNSQALILRTFLNRFYMLFTFGRHRINDVDAAAFSKLVVQKVMTYL